MTDLKEYTDALVLLSEAFSSGYECEHPGHAGTVLGTHAGAGEWYANIRCSDCKSKRVYVMCDRFKRHVQNSGQDFWCSTCFATLPATKLVISFVPVKDSL